MEWQGKKLTPKERKRFVINAIKAVKQAEEHRVISDEEAQRIYQKEYDIIKNKTSTYNKVSGSDFSPVEVMAEDYKRRFLNLSRRGGHKMPRSGEIEAIFAAQTYSAGRKLSAQDIARVRKRTEPITNRQAQALYNRINNQSQITGLRKSSKTVNDIFLKYEKGEITGIEFLREFEKWRKGYDARKTSWTISTNKRSVFQRQAFNEYD